MPDRSTNPDPGAASGIAGLRWVPGHIAGSDEVVLRDVAGRFYGAVQDLVGGGARALWLDGPDDDLVSWLAGGIQDHPTEAAARGWVEDQVRRMQGGEGGA